MKLLMVPSYVEASIKAGRRVAAEAAVPAYEAWVESTGSVAELARLRRTKALLETDTEAATQFTEALDLHAKGGSPFERARTQLAFGEMLRRSRKRAASREHLRAALETFEQLRAVSWAERARAELRASGETARKRDPSTVDELTAQERQIARLVAAGATNKEVAAQLFLSPRTIDFHLRNVFAKLGIASRHELTRFGFGDEEEAVPAAGPAISPVRA
jgi:DNA-binding NarL/FixJ family response regulator